MAWLHTCPTAAGRPPTPNTGTGSYALVCTAWYRGNAWKDTLQVKVTAPLRRLLAPDSLQVCDNTAQLQVWLNAGDKLLWSDGGTSSPHLTKTSGWVSSTVINASGCTIKDSTYITYYTPLPHSPLPPRARLCPGSRYTYTFHADTGISWQWPDGSMADTFSMAAPGKVALQVSNGHCDTVYESEVIRVDTAYYFKFDKEEIYVGENGPPVILHIPEKAGLVSWPDSSQAYSYTLSLKDTGLLQVRIDDGCRVYYAGVRILPQPVCVVYIPNIFSPNEDLLNDQWQVQTICQWKEYTLRIYNRWGQSVWQSGNPSEAWPANGLPEGVYIYVLQGRMEDNARVHRQGSIMLLK